MTRIKVKYISDIVYSLAKKRAASIRTRMVSKGTREAFEVVVVVEKREYVAHNVDFCFRPLLVPRKLES